MVISTISWLFIVYLCLAGNENEVEDEMENKQLISFTPKSNMSSIGTHCFKIMTSREE